MEGNDYVFQTGFTGQMATIGGQPLDPPLTLLRGDVVRFKRPDPLTGEGWKLISITNDLEGLRAFEARVNAPPDLTGGGLLTVSPIQLQLR